MGKVSYLNVGVPEEFLWNRKQEISAIGKRPVSNSFLSKDGFSGDEVAATQYHGGIDRAVCFYPIEHYELWEKEFGKKLKFPSFGENISARKMLETDVFIGDIYQLGEAVVQISQGRIPCSKISSYNGENLLLKRIVETGNTGYFFRVLEEGVVYEDSPISLLDRRQETFSIMRTNQILFHENQSREDIEQLLEIEELAQQWKDKLTNLFTRKN